MRRRDFITLLGSAAAAWPLAARAQAPPLIGHISTGTEAASATTLAAFAEGLKEHGFVEGRNLSVAYRWADGKVDALPAMAAELVRMNPAVIATAGGVRVTRAVKNATESIPIVFTSGGDPVKFGLVPSLSRPGGNVTGISLFSSSLGTKRLEMLQSMMQPGATVAVLVNPNNPTVEEVADIEEAAKKISQALAIVYARNERELDDAFARLGVSKPGALLVHADAYFFSRRHQIVTLAAKLRVPANYVTRDFVVAGGLMSYGDLRADSHRQAGVYVARILKGETPSSLPVIQPSRFQLVLNLRTAKAIDVAFPPSLLALADEVIE
jgi:putative ABC transport system substrate-binding protein